jgi:hypothetical protein
MTRVEGFPSIPLKEELHFSLTPAHFRSLHRLGISCGIACDLWSALRSRVSSGEQKESPGISFGELPKVVDRFRYAGR